MNNNSDTSLGTQFWRGHLHLFIPAHWGLEYCRCCLDPEDSINHTVTPDPATHVGNCTGYRVARPEEILFGVSAWNDDGAACSYASRRTYEEALAFVVDLQAGVDAGRVWDHYQIEERRYYTAVDTNVVVLS